MVFPINISELCEEDIHHVLTAGGLLKRNSRGTHSAKHQRTLRRAALDYINDWRKNGVPYESCNCLLSRCPSFMSKYNLQPRAQLQDSNHHNFSFDGELHLLQESCPATPANAQVRYCLVLFSFSSVF